MNKQSFSANKLVPFKKFSKKISNLASLDDTSVVVDKKGTPLGFVFGRDALISFLEYIDNEFEKNISNPDIAFNNPAGKLIDFIEEKLPVRPKFIRDIKEARAKAKKTGWINFDEIEQSLNVRY